MEANKIIDEFGGTSAVARIFDISPGAVSQWRKNGVPKLAIPYFRMLRPDLFSEPPKRRKSDRR